MKNEVLPRCKRTRWHSVIGDSPIHRAGCARPGHVIADLTRNPEGAAHHAGETRQHNQPYSPSPLMEEESKARMKMMHQHRHVIADLIRNPEVRGRADNKTNQPRTVIPA